MEYLIVGEYIKKTRKELGLTQFTLSRISGISRASIAKIEAGFTKSSLRTVCSILYSMGKQLSDLSDYYWDTFKNF